MQQAVADSVFPGGVILVSREHRVLFCRAYGHANRMTRRAVTSATFFDLASLTKPLATTLALMLLHQRGRIDVTEGLESVLPAFAGSDKAGVTLAQLLSHTSGLPDYRPYHTELAMRPFPERTSALRELLRREPLVHRPGERVLYSDLDFMILGWVVEAASGKRPCDRRGGRPRRALRHGRRRQRFDRRAAASLSWACCGAAVSRRDGAALPRACARHRQDPRLRHADPSEPELRPVFPGNERRTPRIHRHLLLGGPRTLHQYRAAHQPRPPLTREHRHPHLPARPPRCRDACPRGGRVTPPAASDYFCLFSRLDFVYNKRITSMGS
jgi:hypothetical protein